jgi:GxxExxY protein
MDKDPQTHAIIGAALEVHRLLGHGFLERAYQDALVIEFLLRNILFRREVELPISYKGQILPCGYRADFVCYDSIVMEIKALDRLSGTDEAQVINYLRAS